MRSGLLYANKKEGVDASGVVIGGALAGEDVGVSDLRGLISLEEGRIILCKVPRVQNGGSRNVHLPTLSSRSHEPEWLGVWE